LRKKVYELFIAILLLNGLVNIIKSKSIIL